MHLLGLGLLPLSVMPSIKHTRSRTLLCSAFLLFHTRGSQAAPAALLAELTHACWNCRVPCCPHVPSCSTTPGCGVTSLIARAGAEEQI